MYVRTHVYKNMYSKRYADINMHEYILLVCVCVCVHIYTCMYKFIHACINFTSMHTCLMCILAYMHYLTYKHTFFYEQTSIHILPEFCAYIFSKYTLAYTLTHTYMFTHACTVRTVHIQKEQYINRKNNTQTERHVLYCLQEEQTQK